MNPGSLENSPKHANMLNGSTAPAYAGIDCLALPKNFSGAAYYIYYLARNLLELPREVPLAVFCKPVHERLFRSLLKPGDKIVSAPFRGRAGQLFFYEYRLRKLLIRENVKVFLASHYICPPRDERYSLITTFHDMGFLLHPQYYQMIKRAYFGRRIKTFLARADRVVSVSHTTAKSIARLYPQYQPKMTVIHPGINHLPLKPITPKQPPVIEKPYILCVNTFEIRKNIPFIIRVFDYLKQKHKIEQRLLIVGQPANGYKALKQAIKASPFQEDIVIARSVPSDALVHYYQNCDFFINASAYEGFGFTPFEAMYQNVPVFLYQNNAIEEILGSHRFVLDHLDAEKWADAIWENYQNGFRYKPSAKMIEHLNWRNTALATLNLLEASVFSGEASIVS